jgi:hypothetical protein
MSVRSRQWPARQRHAHKESHQRESMSNRFAVFDRRRCAAQTISSSSRIEPHCHGLAALLCHCRHCRSVVAEMEDGHSEYAALADQADRLGDQAMDRRIAGSWHRIASGFRELARLRGAARRIWQRGAGSYVGTNDSIDRKTAPRQGDCMSSVGHPISLFFGRE